MTRIIAGFAGSLTLRVPRSGTRPTSDRVREAIFSALEARDALDGARVLDLYAGSGALGLEAASRGATDVVLVERAKPAAEVCRANADALLKAAKGGRRPHSAWPCAPWPRSSRRPPRASTSRSSTRRTTSTRSRSRTTSSCSRPCSHPTPSSMVERSSRSPEPAWPAGIEPERRRDYGETTLWWARPPDPAQPDAPSQPE